MTQGNSSADNFITQGEQLNESFSGNSYGGRVLTLFSDKPASHESHTLAGVTLYPNPVTDMLYIENTAGFAVSDSIEVYNVFGQRIMQKNNLIDNNIITLDTSSWSRGYYLVKVKADNKVGTYKIVKK